MLGGAGQGDLGRIAEIGGFRTDPTLAELGGHLVEANRRGRVGSRGRSGLQTEEGLGDRGDRSHENGEC